MGSTTITIRVDDAERDDLVARAERERISFSDYIRVRLGLHGHGRRATTRFRSTPSTRRCENSWSSTTGGCTPLRTSTLGGTPARRNPQALIRPGRLDTVESR